MYIAREIDADLKKWKESEKRKPLLLRGVRQCGKTSAVRKLGESFEVYVEINLERHKSLHTIFEGDIDVQRILSRMEIIAKKEIVPGRTLLFIDEIQEAPKALSALRYFYEDMPELHVIAAGSLLEFVLHGKKGESIDFPVGRLRSVFMYPFSFPEFVRGVEGEALYRYVKKLSITELENELHDKLIDLYKTFLVVGGMPEAVSVYKEKNSLIACQEVHRDILYNYKDDFGKYSGTISEDVIRGVFDFSIHTVCSQVKASSAIKGVSSYYFDSCITLLNRAGLVIPVRASSADQIPLGAGAKEANKKLLFFDSGLYLTECGLDVGGLLSSQIFDDMNKGDIVEMQVGLEILKASDRFASDGLYYWYRTGANAEVDYVIVEDGAIVPIEVKASKKGSMQSMRVFLKTHEKSPYGYRLSLENFSEYESIRVLPVYAAFLLGSLRHL